MKCIFCIFFTWLILNIGESASTNMFPMITEPKKNITLPVLLGSDIDVNCSADLGDMIAGELATIYWIINGNFSEYYQKAKVSGPIVTKKGNFTYISLVLHLCKVTAEFYNVPITCILQTGSGNDISTLYFTSLTTEPWAIIIPVILIVLCLLAVFACMYYRTVKNAAH